MGFSGSLILARSKTVLTELPHTYGEAAELAATYGGGWQLVRIFGSDADPEADAAALHTVTRAPVLAASVLDSDYATIYARNHGTGWHWTVNPARALSYVQPFLEEAEGLSGAQLGAAIASTLGLPAGQAAIRLAAWARDAGHDTDSESLRGALETDHTFAEDAVFALLPLLGITSETPV